MKDSSIVLLGNIWNAVKLYINAYDLILITHFDKHISKDPISIRIAQSFKRINIPTSIFLNIFILIAFKTSSFKNGERRI